MTTDGGGWTLVANFRYPGTPAGVAGWGSGLQVNTTFTNQNQSFKLTDQAIRQLATERYRGIATATGCDSGPCTISVHLFWDGSCAYSSNSTSAGACARPFRDVDLTNPAHSNPCDHHFGLTSVECTGGRFEFGSNHSGDGIYVGQGNNVFAGAADNPSHAFSARPGENPSLEIWAR
jgi:hypothetical protein